MIIIECDQGSPEWHDARAGVITASMFTVARSRTGRLNDQQQKYVDAIRSGLSEKDAMASAGYKSAPKAQGIEKAIAGEKVGEFSEEAKNYAFRLAVERISGKPLDEGFQTWQMKRGNELEPMARMEHEIQSGLVVDRVGLVLTDDRAFGASADGFIGEDAGSEYKCFLSPEKLRSFHIDNDASGLFDQVQGCMWITGRVRWHVGLYCPALEAAGRQLWWRVFYRDDDYINDLELDIIEFKALVDFYESELRMRT